MSKKHIRKEIIEQLIQLKTQEIKDLEASKDLFVDSADLDEESSLDLDDFSHQNQSNDAARNIQGRLNQAYEDLDNFKNLSPELVEGITEGNVVFTDKVNFVIGLPIKDFDFENKKFIGISTEAPIYSALSGKNEGDSVEFNGITYSIEEIL